jgi:cyclomaltodextrinase
MSRWSDQAIFYHVYPLGLCGAPAANDFTSPVTPRLAQLHGWLDHIQALGANALYLGPLFESSRHGYDTADYFHVDRRLGDGQTLQQLSADLHTRGMHLMLDAVFNHVGRDFWAFRDVQANGPASPYHDWFHGLRFEGHSPLGDPFQYEGWAGHYELVKLNLAHPAVRAHLFQAVKSWMDDYQVDGLRLDAADCLDPDFIRALAGFCRGLRPDFWLLGEIIHGDYRRWANPQMLDSVTNYECYKGLYSSHVDHNYFEIAYALKRQFGPQGIYRELPLYNFADNHDVNRVASSLDDPAHLWTLYGLLFSLPGVPSLYYGSEWGLTGQRSAHSDAALRPALSLAEISARPPQPGLAEWIARLAEVRHKSPALQLGDYQEALVAHEQLAFLRQSEGQRVAVALNAADRPASLCFGLPGSGRRLVSLLDGSRLDAPNGQVHAELGPHSTRIWQIEEN